MASFSTWVFITSNVIKSETSRRWIPSRAVETVFAHCVKVRSE